MCDSNQSSSSVDNDQMHPTLIPDDISSSGNSYEHRPSSYPDEESGHMMISNEQRGTIPSNVSSTQIHSNTMDSPQCFSSLRKMKMEEVNQSTANDQRALKDVDPSFHKQVWRERVAQWCYDVLDYLEESREVAAVAMNIIDRYLAVLSKESSFDSSVVIREFDYEVISFTALFLAIRVSGSNKELEIDELLKLSSSSGGPQARHIVAAGNSMLEKLSWNHQILTPNSFLRELVALFMIEYHKQEASAIKAVTHESLSNLVEFASYLVEVSVCDIYFSAMAPSKIAFGALALAMMRNSDFFSNGWRHKEFLTRFFQIVHEQTSIDMECPQMNSILSRLLHVYNQSQEAAQSIGRKTIQLETSDDKDSYQTTSFHIIVDDVDESSIADELMDSSNSNNQEEADAIPVNTTTNPSRPVSPLPRDNR